MAGITGNNGPIRELRRLSILVDVEDVATARLAAINGAANKAGNSLNGAGAAAEGARTAFTGVALAAGAGAFAIMQIVRVGARLESTFATIRETAGASAEQMDMIRSKTAELGREMPVTLTEVAQAFREFSYAGFSAEESVGASTAAVELAVASQMNMAQATKTVTQMMNAFQVSNEGVASTTASLTAVFSNSATTIQNLSAATGYAAATMSNLGFEIGEVESALGTLADAGMEGTMAGTALNQAFNKMTSQTGKVQTALNAVGLSMQDFTDEEGQMLPMIDILEIMNERLEEMGITGAGRQRWLIDMFGQRGGRAMAPLLRDLDEFKSKFQTQAVAQFEAAIERMDEFRGMDMPEDPVKMVEILRDRVESGKMSVEELTETLVDTFEMERRSAEEIAAMVEGDRSLEEWRESFKAATTQSELAEAQMETLGGKIKWVRGTLEMMTYTMYTGLRPALGSVLDVFIMFLDLIASNETALKALGLALFTLVGYLTMAAVALSKPIVMARVIIPLYMLFAGKVWGLVLALGALQKAFIAAGGGLAGLKAVLVGLVGLLGGPVTVAFLALLAIAVALKMNLLGLGDAASWLVSQAVGLGESIAELAEWFSELSSTGKILVSVFSLGLIPLLAGLVWAVENLVGIAPDLSIFGDVLGAVADAWFGTGRAIAGFIESFFQTIGDAIRAVGGFITEFTDAAENLDITRMTQLGMEAAFAIADGFTGSIRAVAELIFNATVGAFLDAAGGIVDALLSTKWVDAAAAIVTGIADGIMEHGPTIAKAIVGIIFVALMILPALLAGATLVLMRIGLNFGRWFVEGLRNALPNDKEVFEMAIKPFTDTIADNLDTIHEAGVDVLEALAEGIEDAPEAMVSAIEDRIGDFVDVAEDIGMYFLAGLADTLPTDREMYMMIVQPAIDAITGALGDLRQSGRSIIEAIGEGIADAPNAIISAIKEKLGIFNRFMPSSDADRGPLRNLTEWGEQITETIGEGILEGDLSSPLLDFLGPVDRAIMGLAETAGEVGSRIAGALGGAFSEAADSYRSFVEDVLEKGKDVADSGIDFGKDVIEAITGRITGEITGEGGDGKKGEKSPGGILDALSRQVSSIDTLVLAVRRLIRELGGAAGPSTVPGGIGGVPTGAGDRRETTLLGDDRSVRTALDDRTLVIEQSPEIHFNGGMGGGLSEESVRRQIIRAMGETRRQTMDDIISYMTTGGPAELADDSVGSPEQAEPPDDNGETPPGEEPDEGEEGEEGEEDTGEDGEEDTGEEGEEDDGVDEDEETVI